jgi:hypothetical protein
MPAPALLLERLDAIGQSLKESGHGLALLALGSVGIEQERLDAYSDLDFFVIVEPGYKQQFISNLNWLEKLHPVVYAFQNTDDGCKLLYADGVFCEFAVFEPQELVTAVYAEGRWVWHAPDFDLSLRQSQIKPVTARTHSIEWALGEALTNLYVGVMRFHRGEKLTAQRFIQHFAVDRALELITRTMEETPAFRDEFTPERRFEQRYPTLASHLSTFMQGYDRSPESALAILTFLDTHFEVNAGLREAIHQVIAKGGA